MFMHARARPCSSGAVASLLRLVSLEHNFAGHTYHIRLEAKSIRGPS